MSQDLFLFGSREERIQHGLSSLRQGKGVIVVDDDDRENEGDMIFPSETLTEEQMALLIREGSGIVCLCIEADLAQKLSLPYMVTNNTSTFGTAFTVSIEAAQGVTTGVSAHDRVATVKAAIQKQATPEHLHRPGHIFPLISKPNGVLDRKGHTEATIDLMKLAGRSVPSGVLCEITNPDGTMAKLPEIVPFSKKYALPTLSVEDIAWYRQSLGGGWQ